MNQLIYQSHHQHHQSSELSIIITVIINNNVIRTYSGVVRKITEETIVCNFLSMSKIRFLPVFIQANTATVSASQICAPCQTCSMTADIRTPTAGTSTTRQPQASVLVGGEARKLFGNLEDQRRTAAFVHQGTGVSI